MKSFIFKDKEYFDLPSLGYAFACDFNSALEAIKDKAFVKFVRKFKQYRVKIFDVLYNTKYLQNTLTFFIHYVTEEHLIMLGGKCYKTFDDLRKDIKTNESIVLFLNEKGLRKTIIDTLADEKEKQDVLALEDYYYDEFALNYAYNYENYDSIDDINKYLSPIINTETERFKAWNDLFKNEELLLVIGNKYSLKDALAIHNATYPIYNGFRALKNEIDENLINEVLTNAFYWNLLKNLKKYKYKGSKADFLLKKIKKFSKLVKKSKKYPLDKRIDMNEQMMGLYLEFVDLYKQNQIIPKKKNDDLQLVIPYCNTYACVAFLSEKYTSDELENDKEYIPMNKVYYDLKKLRKSLRNHYAFAVWSIVFIVLFAIYFVISIVLTEEIREYIPIKPAIEEEMGLLSFLCIGALALGLIGNIVILILRAIAYKKYNGLCKLAYYRNNESILAPKQLADFQKLVSKEEKNAKKIDRFYRFYGAVTAGLLTLALTLIGLGLCVNYLSSLLGEETLAVAEELLASTDKIYLLFIPMLVTIVLGCLRHKKTAWSILLAVVIGLGGSIGIIFLAGIL